MIRLPQQLLGLAPAVERRASSCVARGTLLSATLDGIWVDLGSGKGFAPRSELHLDWLLRGPERGSRWRGHVVQEGDAVAWLSSFAPAARRRRAERRTRTLTRLLPGTLATGRVVGVGGTGALVAFDGGLVWGVVPAEAMELPVAARVAPDRRLAFAVVGPADEGDREIHLRVWPEAPARAGGPR